MHRHATSRESGFTLMELLIVMSIISILSAVLVPTYKKQRDLARIGAAVQMADSCVRSAFAVSSAENGGRFPDESLIGSYGYRGLAHIGRLNGCELPVANESNARPGKVQRDEPFEPVGYWCWHYDDNDAWGRVTCNAAANEPLPEDYVLVLRVRNVNPDLRGAYLGVSGSQGVEQLQRSELPTFFGPISVPSSL